MTRRDMRLTPIVGKAHHETDSDRYRRVHSFNSTVSHSRGMSRDWRRLVCIRRDASAHSWEVENLAEILTISSMSKGRSRWGRGGVGRLRQHRAVYPTQYC